MFFSAREPRSAGDDIVPSRFLGIGKAASFILLFALLCDARPAAAQFKQLGPKLIGEGSVGRTFRGIAVALSGDGNTAIMGGPSDNSGVGAAWVFTRRGSAWIQQGSKLVGTGGLKPAQQGYAVALSADGNTAILGGFREAWVFTRSGGIWSGDGNTALIGGFADDSLNGAAWIFTRKDSVWAQQGSKLVGSGAVGRIVHQGHSVALSADGSTAIVGGVRDAWVFARSGDTWSQLESKLISIDPDINAAQYGLSVALSASGRIAIVGAWTDTLEGGAQVFALPRPHSPEAK